MHSSIFHSSTMSEYKSCGYITCFCLSPSPSDQAGYFGSRGSVSSALSQVVWLMLASSVSNIDWMHIHQGRAIPSQCKVLWHRQVFFSQVLPWQSSESICIGRFASTSSGKYWAVTPTQSFRLCHDILLAGLEVHSYALMLRVRDVLLRQQWSVVLHSGVDTETFELSPLYRGPADAVPGGAA